MKHRKLRQNSLTEKLRPKSTRLTYSKMLTIKMKSMSAMKLSPEVMTLARHLNYITLSSGTRTISIRAKWSSKSVTQLLMVSSSRQALSIIDLHQKHFLGQPKAPSKLALYIRNCRLLWCQLKRLRKIWSCSQASKQTMTLYLSLRQDLLKSLVQLNKIKGFPLLAPSLRQSKKKRKFSQEMQMMLDYMPAQVKLQML